MKKNDELKLKEINNKLDYSNNDNKINLNKMEAKPDNEDKDKKLNLKKWKLFKNLSYLTKQFLRI